MSSPSDSWSAGLWLFSQRPLGNSRLSRLAIGYSLAVVMIGVGSIAFHGPQGSGAQWLHDVPIVVALAMVPCWNIAQRRQDHERLVWWSWLGFVGLAALLLAAMPGAEVVLIAPVAVAAIVTEVMVGRPTRIWGPVVVVGAFGAILNFLGRTDAPLCDPSSWIQLHGAWHGLTAVAFLLWGRAAFTDRGHVSSEAGPR